MDPTKQAANLFLESTKVDNLYALYRGIVENIDDPDRLGRVQVRIWFLHGDDTATPTYALPWAEVSEIGGGGYDYGSFNPPPIGSGVWISFEGGLIDFPVVIGTFRGKPVRDKDNENIMLTKGGKPSTETAWKPPDGELETPKEVFEDVYSGDPHPTRRVAFKSYKGHTIYCEDGDGLEFFRIIDRAGQMLEMYCPVDKVKQAGNKAQRGTRHSGNSDQLSHDAMADRRAILRLIDLSGQEVKLDASDLNEQVIIKSICRATGNEQSITLKSGKGKEGVVIRDYLGDQIKLDPNSDTPIRIEDIAGNAIIFDKENGKVQIVASKKSEEVVKQKSLLVDGEYTQNITGDSIKEVLGNIKTKTSGNASINSLGQCVANVGATLSILVTNAPLPGSTTPPTPDSTAIEVGTYIGGIKISAKAGDIEYSTLAGNVDVSTVAGNAELTTALGVCRISGTTIRLGSALATEPLVLGTKLQTALTQLITVLSTHTHLTGMGPTIAPTEAVAMTAVNAQISAALSTFANIEK